MFSVLSDKGKKRIYDAGMLGFLGDDDDEVSLFFKSCFFFKYSLRFRKIFHVLQYGC